MLEADLLAQALHGIFSNGDDGILAGPMVLLMLAWLTKQTDKIQVVTTLDEGGHQPVRAILATGRDGWCPPTLSFSVLCWGLTQVRHSWMLSTVCGDKRANYSKLHAMDFLQVVKIVCGGGAQNNSDVPLQNGVICYAYAVLRGADPRTKDSIVQTLIPEWDPDAEILSDVGRLLYAHALDGRHTNAIQLLPMPADFSCWCAEALHPDTYTGVLQIKLSASSNDSTAPATDNSTDVPCPATTSHRDSSSPLALVNAPPPTGDSDNMVAASVAAPAAQFVKMALSGTPLTSAQHIVHVSLQSPGGVRQLLSNVLLL